ncbi:hypothetical protein [Hyphomicrobium sp. DMF-1]|jgi:hypothetical protein|uniref:hypothetical protein n=1 Tax=Hyphomicrobium sp. DMF-1 TaxID=3019544 RepID=UPI0022EC1615|nr:hypothetical protein [Hyphomicrobium sp. DMF-1]WBT37833.1 hypothetical protein PE058_19570 [Hyphomicrobium sp. DMF-1]
MIDNPTKASDTPIAAVPDTPTAPSNVPAGSPPPVGEPETVANPAVKSEQKPAAPAPQKI